MILPTNVEKSNENINDEDNINKLRNILKAYGEVSHLTKLRLYY